MPTTHEQSDFAHCKFLVFCSLQPTKSACSAAAEKCLSGVGQPLSSVSGRKRYNTLDFPKENRVPTGMLLAPIGNPEPRDSTPLDTPHIFPENGTQTVKMQFDTFPQKIQNRCNLHPCGDENYSGFLFAALIENCVLFVWQWNTNHSFTPCNTVLGRSTARSICHPCRQRAKRENLAE